MYNLLMETTLILSEIVFNFIASVASITIGVLCAIVTYHLILITKELEELSRNLNNASSEAGERINEIIDRLSDLPILSYFLKKRSPVRGGPSDGEARKGRGKSSKK